MRRIGACLAILAISRAGAAASDSPPTKNAQPIYRPSDRRPRHDDARLKERGIAVFESKRLKLYTDLPAEKITSVLPAVDAAYDALVEYFGPLPQAREGTEFQVTGYLMADQEPFRRFGLLSDNLPRFLHGRHRGLEFWANAQETDYYRRHLVIHEFTHCFMLAGPGAFVPPWYMEGMAELFATHQIDTSGRCHFRVMPDREEDFEGLGRIRIVRGEITHNRWKSLDDVRRMGAREYAENTGYAWTWAACAFLDTHPRYAPRFRALGKRMTIDEFPSSLSGVFGSDWSDLQTEWALFSRQLQHGHDIVRAAIDFQTGRPLGPGETSRKIAVAADRGWQPSGIQLREGVRYRLTATGRAALGRDPRPWPSEPQGISIVYSEGRPIGTLLAAIRRDRENDKDPLMLRETVVGRGATLLAEATGTLYFRINDRWGSLADNEGSYTVDVRAESASP